MTFEDTRLPSTVTFYEKCNVSTRGQKAMVKGLGGGTHELAWARYIPAYMKIHDGLFGWLRAWIHASG